MITFEFTYRSDYDEGSAPYPVESEVTKRVTFDDASTWPAILYEFASMLGGIWGYDVLSSIQVKGKSLDEAAHPLE